MEFEVKGIKFTRDDLCDLELSELKVGSLSRHHLFHFLGGSKPMLILRAGDYIDPGFVSKYIDRGVEKFSSLELVTLSEIQELDNLFSELKCANSEKAMQDFRVKFLNTLKKRYTLDNAHSFLGYVIYTFENFYFFTDQILDNYQRTSSILFSRALRASTIGVINSILNGYLDWKYLRDFYNTCFIMDYGLVQYGEFHYTLFIACEAERNKPNSGLKVLQKLRRSEGELALFHNHAKISADAAYELKDNFSNPGLIEVIKYHHEKHDGSGFPNGIPYTALSDFELIPVFCDHLVPFSEEVYKLGDLKQSLFGEVNEIEEFINNHKLPVKSLHEHWKALLSWLLQEEVKQQEVVS